MRVTVSIATRDRPLLLHHALASVFAQSRAVEEIIVVDDGAGEAAADVCRAFEGVMLARSNGRGIAAARNIAVAAASGDIVVVQDDDDAMMPSRIADHVAAFDNDTHVTCGAWMNVTPRDRDALLRLAPGHAAPNLNGLLLGNACIAHGAAAYRSASLRAHPYDESLRVGSDMDLHARLFASGAQVRHTGTVVLVRRLHTESVTQRHSDEQKQVKNGLKTRYLAQGHPEKMDAPLAQPLVPRSDLASTLAHLGVDGAGCVLGAMAKTLAAAGAVVQPEPSGGQLIPMGSGGFVDVLVPLAEPSAQVAGSIAGVAPLMSGQSREVGPGDDDSFVGDPVASLGLLEGGGRILIDIDHVDRASLLRLERAISPTSPTWRFVADHPVLRSAFAAAPALAIASNRFASVQSLARAFQSVAEATSALGLPATRLGVGAVQRGRLIGLAV